MMRIIFFTGIMLLFAACSTNKEFTIEGTTKTGFEGKVYLKEFVDLKWIPVDSTIIENQGFRFEGSVDIPDMYAVSFDGHKGSKRFCLENTDYLFEIGNNESKSTVSGGSFQPGIEAFENEMSILKAEETKLRARYRKEMGDDALGNDIVKSTWAEIETVLGKQAKLAQNYIHLNNASPYAPIVLDSYLRRQLEISKLDSLFNTIADDAKCTNYGKRVRVIIDNIIRSAVGQPFIDISAPGVDGKNITLSEVRKKHKVVFIEFWASWCGPCRAGIPKLKKTYKKYKPEGFEIYAVSYDTDKEKWIKAIEDEELDWINVSNLKAWGCPTKAQYAITGIPDNILISPD
ncbi:MAG: TlpA disulfide reductase family protein [Draconibacterium sp.]|nr:TlpA disulfide reductase family protein [Draconibacterium sp.]